MLHIKYDMHTALRRQSCYLNVHGIIYVAAHNACKDSCSIDMIEQAATGISIDCQPPYVLCVQLSLATFSSKIYCSLFLHMNVQPDRMHSRYITWELQIFFISLWCYCMCRLLYSIMCTQYTYNLWFCEKNSSCNINACSIRSMYHTWQRAKKKWQYILCNDALYC